MGGLGEIGKNMTVFEYGRNQIIIDCGIMFPESDMYGIDFVIPQFDFIAENRDKLRGIVLTHGHLDHIGGLPYLLNHINAPISEIPIYGTALTLGLVKQRLDEMPGRTKDSLLVLSNKVAMNKKKNQVTVFPELLQLQVK